MLVITVDITEQSERQMSDEIDKMDLEFLTGYMSTALKELKDVVRVTVQQPTNHYVVQITYLARGDDLVYKEYVVNDVAKLVDTVKQTYQSLKSNNDSRHHTYLHGVAVEMSLNQLFHSPSEKINTV